MSSEHTTNESHTAQENDEINTNGQDQTNEVTDAEEKPWDDTFVDGKADENDEVIGETVETSETFEKDEDNKQTTNIASMDKDEDVDKTPKTCSSSVIDEAYVEEHLVDSKDKEDESDFKMEGDPEVILKVIPSQDKVPEGRNVLPTDTKHETLNVMEDLRLDVLGAFDPNSSSQCPEIRQLSTGIGSKPDICYMEITPEIIINTLNELQRDSTASQILRFMETNTRFVCGSCEGRINLITDDLQDKLDCAVQVGILRVNQDRYRLPTKLKHSSLSAKDMNSFWALFEGLKKTREMRQEKETSRSRRRGTQKRSSRTRDVREKQETSRSNQRNTQKRSSRNKKSNVSRRSRPSKRSRNVSRSRSRSPVGGGQSHSRY